MTESDLLPPGTIFGRYAIVRRIGAGGMGAVYEATHTDLKKQVAIKVLHPATAPDSEARLRFLREGEAASKIRHPHVVDIYDVGSESGIVYLVMEYLEGEDLGRALHREGSLSPKRIADIMLPVSAALLAAHEVGVVHRDLKPANIFLARDRHGVMIPKVLDFGISKILHDQKAQGLTSSGTLLGTPYYMSPEQAHGNRALTAATDQYSLGVILYQAATGKRPFESESMYQVLHSIVEGRFLAPRSARPELAEEFEVIILRAMKNDAADRFLTLREFGAELLGFASERARALWRPVFDPGSRELVSQDLPGPADGVFGTPLVDDAPYASAAYSEPLKARGIISSTQNQTLSPGFGIVAVGERRSRKLLTAGIAMLVVAGVVLGLLLVRSRRANDFESTSLAGPDSTHPAKAPTAAGDPSKPEPEKADELVPIESMPKTSGPEGVGDGVGLSPAVAPRRPAKAERGGGALGGRRGAKPSPKPDPGSKPDPGVQDLGANEAPIIR